MDLSDSKKERARRILSQLYTPPGVIDADELLLEGDVYDAVKEMISSAHDIYIDSVTGKALLVWREEYETGYEKLLDKMNRTERIVLFILYLLYRHPFIPEERRSGKPAADQEVSRDTIIRLTKIAGLNRQSVDRALSRLTRLGYLDGFEWPRRTGIRLRALPNGLFERVEESAFRWTILKEAGVEPVLAPEVVRDNDKESDLEEDTDESTAE